MTVAPPTDADLVAFRDLCDHLDATAASQQGAAAIARLRDALERDGFLPDPGSVSLRVGPLLVHAAENRSRLLVHLPLPIDVSTARLAPLLGLLLDLAGAATSAPCPPRKGERFPTPTSPTS